MKTIGKFAIFGAIGFGIGHIIGGIWPAGLFISGAVGGASLGLALKDRKRAGLLALAGAIGFAVGRLLLAGFGFAFGEQWSGLIFYAIAGAIMGAVGGFSLGLALRNWARVGILALAGAIGFGIGYVAYRQIMIQQIMGVPVHLIWGLIGGAFLGAALGYLEKRKADRERNPNSLWGKESLPK